MFCQDHSITMKRYIEPLDMGIIELQDSWEPAEPSEPLEHIYQTAMDFLQSEYVSSVVNSGKHNGSGPLKYRGNMIIQADPEFIDLNTRELRKDVYSQLLRELGKNGYDDPERLNRAMEEVGIKHPKRDHDGALAIDSEYRLLGAGRFVRLEDELMREWETSDERMISDMIKGDYVGGKHMAGWMFSRMGPQDSSAVVLSENGDSIITYSNGP